MASLNKIIYTLGSVLKDETQYLTVKELSKHFDEDNIIYRLHSQLVSNPGFFSKKKMNYRLYVRLNGNGRNYYSRIKDRYDPISDTIVMSPIKIEVEDMI